MLAKINGEYRDISEQARKLDCALFTAKWLAEYGLASGAVKSSGDCLTAMWALMAEGWKWNGRAWNLPAET